VNRSLLLLLGVALCPIFTSAQSKADATLKAEPLPPPSESKKVDTLFTSLPVEKTHVDFINPILKDHPMAHLYASAMGCGGVAVGDIDNDGRPDLFFTGGPVPNRLFRQTDTLQFEDITEKAGLSSGEVWSTGASIIDIDNDNDLDIYVCNYDAKNFLYINRGDGTFDEAAETFGLDFASAGHTPAFCDVDNDGNLDLYLLTNFFYDPRGLITEQIVGMKDGKPAVLPAYEKFYGITSITPGSKPGEINIQHDTIGQSDILLKNNGDRTFTRLTPPGTLIGKGNSALWWDPNDDGWADLYVANDFKDPDFYFKNHGDGTLDPVIKSTVPHTTWFSMGSDSADLDGDALPDLVVADMSGTNHFKQKISMGAMSDNAEFLVTAEPRQYMRNTVFLNTGTDRLREAAHMTGLANSDWTWTVRLSDFDNDGRIDVFFSNGMAVNLNVADNEAAVRALPGETEWAKHQRAKSGSLKEQNLAFKNLGDLHFEDVSKAWGLDHVGMSYAATAADLDRDGDLELIVVNLDEPVSIYQNHSNSSHRTTVELRGVTSNRRGLGATVRVETASGKQSSYMTLARGYMASGEALLHFGLGAETQIKSLSVQWPSGHLQTFKDLAADQHFTITEPDTKPPARTPKVKPATIFEPLPTALTKLRHREQPFDDFARQPLLPNKVSQLGPAMAWADVDADGDDDLYFAGAKGSTGQLFRNDAGGAFTSISKVTFAGDTVFEDMGALFFDADSDGDQDLYVVSGGNECDAGDESLRDRLYFNDGKGAFTRGTLPDLRDSGGPIAAADFDSDGDLDLFVGGRLVPGKYPSAPQSRLLRNDGSGKFTDVTTELAPSFTDLGMITSAIWTDSDNDGAIDLLLTCDWAPPRLFRNLGEGKLQDRTSAAGFDRLWGWWNGVSAGDVDNDGDIDFAISNFGQNTKYHPTYDKPVRLFYGDFDDSGVEQLVEAKYEGDILYPVRGRSCSSHAMPFLLNKFDTYTEFASATLVDIYTPQKLSKARQYAATELRSGILINDGKGFFEFRPLPHIAQIAPGFGMSMNDIDGDGKLDIYMVGNFYSPQAETGHMAGGVSQLLLGIGDGSFTPVAPHRSGLVVPGDAKSLTCADIDGDGNQEYIIGINDDSPMVFRQRESHPSLAIKLVGNTINHAAIGARVTVQTDGLPNQTKEVYAGSGYLSQDPLTLHFSAKSDSKATTVEVRWPDNKISTHKVTDGSRATEIKYPL
jgi:hypothetical protein